MVAMEFRCYGGPVGVPRRRLLQAGYEAEVVHRDEEEVRDRWVVHAVRRIQKQFVQRSLYSAHTTQNTTSVALIARRICPRSARSP